MGFKSRRWKKFDGKRPKCNEIKRMEIGIHSQWHTGRSAMRYGSHIHLLVCSVLLLGATAMSNENLLNTNAFARSLSARIIYFHYVWPCECVSVCVWTISILHLSYECGFRFHDAWFIETYTVLRIRQFAFLMSAAYTHTIFCIHISEIRQFFGEQNTNTRTIKANVFSFKCFAIWMRNWKLCAKRERESINWIWVNENGNGNVSRSERYECRGPEMKRLNNCFLTKCSLCFLSACACVCLLGIHCRHTAWYLVVCSLMRGRACAYMCACVYRNNIIICANVLSLVQFSMNGIDEIQKPKNDIEILTTLLSVVAYLTNDVLQLHAVL